MRLPGGPTVLVIGDVMTDIVVRPEGPVVHGADRRAEIRVLPGGSGANQAAWLARFGVRTVFAGRVGSADHAQQAQLLADCGVIPLLACDAALPTGTIVTLLAPDGERSFLTDRGANRNLCRADLPDSLLDDVTLVHVSGYALFDAGPRAAVLDLLAGTRRRNIAWTIDPASHSFLAEVGAAKFLGWTQGARICFANASEAAMLAGSSDPERQPESLTGVYELAVVKRGAEGVVAGHADGRRWFAAAPAVEVRDTSGAGDALLAGFLSRYVCGEPIDACLAAGVAAGSQAVMKLGARPSADHAAPAE